MRGASRKSVVTAVLALGVLGGTGCQRGTDLESRLPVKLGQPWAEAKAQLLTLDARCRDAGNAGGEHYWCDIPVDLGLEGSVSVYAGSEGPVGVDAVRLALKTRTADCRGTLERLGSMLGAGWKVDEVRGSQKRDKSRPAQLTLAAQVPGDRTLRASCLANGDAVQVELAEAWRSVTVDYKSPFEEDGAALSSSVGALVAEAVDHATLATQNEAGAEARAQALARVQGSLKAALASVPARAGELSPRSRESFQRFQAAATGADWLQREVERALARKGAQAQR